MLLIWYFALLFFIDSLSNAAKVDSMLELKTILDAIRDNICATCEPSCPSLNKEKLQSELGSIETWSEDLKEAFDFVKAELVRSRSL